MEGFASVVQVLANLSVIALCAFLVAFLVRLKGTLQALEKDVRDLTTRAMPILDNVEVITDKVRNIADNIDDQVELVKDSINSIREILLAGVSFGAAAQNGTVGLGNLVVVVYTLVRPLEMVARTIERGT